MKLNIGDLPASQQPDWPDQGHLNSVLDVLSRQEPLVTSRETQALTTQLGRVANGEAFVLQAGPCAESLASPPESVKDLFSVILSMTVVLGYGAGVPVVKVGRIAGQFGKPRSRKTETQNGITLPSYRGDNINRPGFSAAERQPNPGHLIEAFEHSKATLKIYHELATGGFADLEKMHERNVNFAASGAEVERARYQIVAEGITKAIRFMKACGINVANLPSLHEAEAYTSHEALVLAYEEALTRPTSDGVEPYDSSAHMLWIGERTRDINEAHVAFAATINNPIGVKLGPTTSPEEVIALCEKINPSRIPGKLTIISRMGADTISDSLPPLLQAVRDAGYPVAWICDPMHGNTITAETGEKTRKFETIVEEVVGFFEACNDEDTWPGGLHLEITGEDVTECLGGSEPTTVTDLSKNYTTVCDPRLNPTQSIELAFLASELLRKK